MDMHKTPHLKGIQKIVNHLSFLLSMLRSSSSTLTPTQMTEFLTLSQRLSLNTLPDAHFHHLVKVVLFC